MTQMADAQSQRQVSRPLPVANASPVTALISQSQLPDCQVFRFVGYFSEVFLPTALCPNRPIISATYLKDKCFYSRATDCCLRKLPVTEQVPYLTPYSAQKGLYPVRLGATPATSASIPVPSFFQPPVALAHGSKRRPRPSGCVRPRRCGNLLNLARGPLDARPLHAC